MVDRDYIAEVEEPCDALAVVPMQDCSSPAAHNKMDHQDGDTHLGCVPGSFQAFALAPHQS